MRLKSIFAACAALATIGLVNPQQAAAYRTDTGHPAGWGRDRVVNHWVYYPRYVHNYNVDPYAYQYSPRGYYPYYNSGYWRPAAEVRARNYQHYHYWNVQAPRFKYRSSWGMPWHGSEHKSGGGAFHR